MVENRFRKGSAVHASSAATSSGQHKTSASRHSKQQLEPRRSSSISSSLEELIYREEQRSDAERTRAGGEAKGGEDKSEAEAEEVKAEEVKAKKEEEVNNIIFG